MSSTTENPVQRSQRNRKRALLAIIPLVAIAAFDLALLLLWGIEPLWAFAVLPPMIFVTALGWIYFGAEDSEDEEGSETSTDTAR